MAQGTHVILTEHSNSERGYLKVHTLGIFVLLLLLLLYQIKLSQVLKQKLEESFKGRLAVLISARDADPLRVM